MYSNKKGSFSVFFVIVLAIVLGGLASFTMYMNSLPPISQLQSYQPNLVSQIVANDGTVIKTFGSFKYKKLKSNEIPDILKKAIIATEDKNFYVHKGFDPIALVRSSIKNLKAKRVVQGASTITQQLARILFLSTERTFDRKIKELIIASRLEKTLSKDEILTMYLNNIYLGEGAYGAAAAAETYFSKNLKDITLAEAALIAGLPQAPSAYSPYRSMKLAKKRRKKVLSRMLTMGVITKAQADKANNARVNIDPNYRVVSTNKAPYFSDYVMKELESLGFTNQEIQQGGYKIYTTLDYNAYKKAQSSITFNMRNWGLNKPFNQAALFSFDTTTGKILSYIGGKDYADSQFDRVTQAVRQPGSSFKMFVYTTAMERGYTPNDIYEDRPVHISKWSPRNYNNKYRGKLPLHKALAVSSNVVAVRLIMDVGVDEVARTARRLGITTPIAGNATIALGSSGVKLYDITRAYGVLANGGIKVTPYSVERVETSNGRVIYRKKSSNNSRVLDIRTVSYMVEMLKQVVQAGTGRGANIGRPAAGKTGTTDSYRDAWFIGFTPDIVTGVWVGNDNNTPTRKLTGGSLPAIIWRQYMKEAEKNRPVSKFMYPEITLIKENEYMVDIDGESLNMNEGIIIDGNNDNNAEVNNIVVPKGEDNSRTIKVPAVRPPAIPKKTIEGNSNILAPVPGM